jgi:hypothetical protein
VSARPERSCSLDFRWPRVSIADRIRESGMGGVFD